MHSVAQKHAEPRKNIGEDVVDLCDIRVAEAVGADWMIWHPQTTVGGVLDLEAELVFGLASGEADWTITSTST